MQVEELTLSTLAEAGPDARVSGEHSLLRAVLLRAISDVDEHKDRTAYLWTRERYGDSTPFSFTWICRMLDICPIKVRRVIKESYFRPVGAPLLVPKHAAKRTTR